jgi:hypothetical protein
VTSGAERLSRADVVLLAWTPLTLLFILDDYFKRARTPIRPPRTGCSTVKFVLLPAAI